MSARFEANYRLDHFSLNRTAETIAAQLARLARRAEALDAGADRPDTPAEQAGDLCHEIAVFAACAAPVLIDLADQVLGGPAPHPVGRTTGITEVPARRLPLLATLDDPAGADGAVPGAARDLAGQAG